LKLQQSKVDAKSTRMVMHDSTQEKVF
jgi:hypothetical protein